MKIILLFIIAILLINETSFAQVNKPAPGTWGIGYGVSLSQDFNQSFLFSRMLNGGWEAGTGIGFIYFHTTNETEDSTVVSGISGALAATSTNTQKSSLFGFSIAPFLVKHCNVTSNLDLYFGPIIPIRLGTKNKSTFTYELSAPDYLNTSETIENSPAHNLIGLGLVLGSRFFFYPNLAIGATYNLSGTYSFQSGDQTSKTTSSNSGSDNPLSGEGSSTETSHKIKTNSTNIGTSSNFQLNLTFYFE